MSIEQPHIDVEPVSMRARRRLRDVAVAVEAVPGLRPHTALPDAVTLLTGRAALLGLHDRGRISANGSTRLMNSATGTWALTLARPDDLATVPALVETSVGAGSEDPWAEIERRAPTMTAHQWVSRARMLDLPAAVLGETGPAGVVHRRRGIRRDTGGDELVVADLSSLWAGPLCGRLLADHGATVIKVESPSRPDGARDGNRDFFDWMNHGKLSYAVDFHRDRAKVERLLRVADVVIEASRPRALRRLGLGPEDLEPAPGQVWLRITGHGTEGDRENWVAFGDDAAVAGGLVRLDGQDSTPVFLGDAIADPLTGIEAARSVTRALADGGGALLEISMAATAARYAQQDISSAGAPPTGTDVIGADRPPPRKGRAAEQGSDNDRVEELVRSRVSRR